MTVRTSSLSKYLIEKVGGTEDDRERIGGSMVAFGKEKAAEFPQTFSVVLAYLRRNPPSSVVRRVLCKPAVRSGGVKSTSSFEPTSWRQQQDSTESRRKRKETVLSLFGPFSLRADIVEMATGRSIETRNTWEPPSIR